MSQSNFNTPKFFRALGISDLEIASIVKDSVYSADIPSLKKLSANNAAKFMADYGDEIVESLAETQNGMDYEVPSMSSGETWGEFCLRLIIVAVSGECLSMEE
tara:strand:- start:606 stop:914 length:309 start_codon:yes stop_codon:yes gene_type:complete